MKYTKIYVCSGTNQKADETDYIDRYIAENGAVIKIKEVINTNYRWYSVNGKSFDTLKAAKAYVEAH